jgi:hypothetical protein
MYLEQGKRIAEQLIGRLLSIRQEFESARRQLDTLRSQSTQRSDPENDVTIELEADIEQMRVKIVRMEEVIGEGETRTVFDDAKRDPFLAARLSAHGIRERLMSRIQARKFELSKLEQHSGRPALGQLLHSV